MTIQKLLGVLMLCEAMISTQAHAYGEDRFTGNNRAYGCLSHDSYAGTVYNDCLFDLDVYVETYSDKACKQGCKLYVPAKTRIQTGLTELPQWEVACYGREAHANPEGCSDPKPKK